jgi:plasmid stabilization system protein ParE
VAKVLFHPEADAEYLAAREWYRARSLQAAFRFESELERVLDLIAANPDTFPKYDDNHRFALLRRFPYCVIYQQRSENIDVIAVAHTSRSVGYWHGRS